MLEHVVSMRGCTCAEEREKGAWVNKEGCYLLPTAKRSRMSITFPGPAPIASESCARINGRQRAVINEVEICVHTAKQQRTDDVYSYTKNSITECDGWNDPPCFLLEGSDLFDRRR